MPRFFFNVVEGHSQTLVRDSEGAIFLSVDDARKEAVGLARDFAKHGFCRPMQTWKLVVADEDGHHALTVSLRDVRPRKIEAWVDQIRHFAMFETRIHPNILGWLLAAAMICVLMQSLVKTASSREIASFTKPALLELKAVIANGFGHYQDVAHYKGGHRPWR